MRKTKIICTIGPASANEKTLTQMCLAGMNVARLNFSHGSHEEHKEKIDLIKRVRENLDMPIPIMLDTKGPEYRIKTFKSGSVEVQDGAQFIFTTDDIEGDETKVSVSFEGLIRDLSVGDRILVNNGLVVFEVNELTDTEAICTTIVGGTLSNRKSMSFPNKVMSGPYLSEKDKSDLLFGIQEDVDFIAASFVRCKEDVIALRKFLDYHVAKGDLKATKFELGATNQFALRHKPNAYPNFKIENVCVNGMVWDKAQNKIINVYNGRTIRENASSCGFVIRYGNFDFFTAGDIGDYYDFECIVAKAVGKVDAAKANHHLSPHWMVEKSMKALTPQVMSVTSFSNREIQPDQSKFGFISKLGCKMYCTSVGEAMLKEYPKVYKKCRSVSGHVVFRVEPNGKRFWVYVLDDFDSQYRIKMVDGPFKAK